MVHEPAIAKQQRRDSLQQRNMLLSMRLKSSNTRKSLSATSRISSTPQTQTKKHWRVSLAQSSSPKKKFSSTRIPSPERQKLKLKSPSPKRQKDSLHPVRDNRDSRIPSPAKLKSNKFYSPVKNPVQKSPLQYKPMALDDFEIGKKLGKGKFGKVYCVRHKKTGFICALKAMEKKEITQYNVQKQFRREVEIQASLRHPNLTQLYGYFYDDKRVYLLMEYLVNGELYRHLRVNGPFNDILASYYVNQMADALNYMHDRNVLHRDIKPENILIGFQNTLKLTDFGWSVISTTGAKRKTLCGTLDYLSPELVKYREYDEKVDVWALGVLAYELLVGAPPFEEVSKELTYKRIVRRDLRFPDQMSIDARDLIGRLLENDPSARISLKDVLSHPWIVKNKPFWHF